nr:FecR family protein [Pedobacter panaciterrae]
MTEEILIKFLLKETSEEESIAVQTWLDEATSNRVEFARLEKIWTASKSLSSKSNINEEEAWIKFKAKTNSGSKEAIVIPIKQTFGWLKIAAVLVLIAGAWMMYNVFGPTNYTDLSASNKVITEHLPDGSEVTLNKNSQISYATDFKDDRSVKLKNGDVFFNVAHDKSRPFVIKVDKVSITVVGTSFNVKHLEGETEVIVETGIVKVSNGKEIVELRKGEKVLIKEVSSKLIKEQNTDQLYNYYRSGEFVFYKTPLLKVAEILNEAYNAHIVIKDASIANETYNTTLKASKSLDSNLNIIRETVQNLKIDRNDGQIILSKIK